MLFPRVSSQSHLGPPRAPSTRRPGAPASPCTPSSPRGGASLALHAAHPPPKTSRISPLQDALRRASRRSTVAALGLLPSSAPRPKHSVRTFSPPVSVPGEPPSLHDAGGGGAGTGSLDDWCRGASSSGGRASLELARLPRGSIRRRTVTAPGPPPLLLLLKRVSSLRRNAAVAMVVPGVDLVCVAYETRVRDDLRMIIEPVDICLKRLRRQDPVDGKKRQQSRSTVFGRLVLRNA